MNIFLYSCYHSADDVGEIVALQGALKFNGGGHINHSIFWQNMSPNGGGEPEGNEAVLKQTDIVFKLGSFNTIDN